MKRIWISPEVDKSTKVYIFFFFFWIHFYLFQEHFINLFQERFYLFIINLFILALDSLLRRSRIFKNPLATPPMLGGEPDLGF